MASPTLKSLSYRTFDSLLNEVYMDLSSYAREGLVEPGQLIKVAQRVNQEIGLKINGTKQTILEVEHSRAKLPSDFYILNFALVCHHHTVYEPSPFNGLHTENRVIPVKPENIVICPDNCQCDNCTKTNTCCEIDCDPWKQNKVFTQCNDTQEVQVIEYNSGQVRTYEHFQRLYMVPSKEADAFCSNSQFRDAPYTGNIKNGFLYIPNLTHGRLYICYLGALEDEDGNLLVLNHPKINDFYEWALKTRILENLYLNGEPDIERRLQFAKTELKLARAESLSIVATPDFHDLKQTIQMNRQATYSKYFHPFSKLFANSPGFPFAINTDRIDGRTN
jgi:hypothetical protein